MKILVRSIALTFFAMATNLACACNEIEPSLEDLYAKDGVKIIGPILASEIEEDMIKRQKKLGLAVGGENESLKEFKEKIEFGDKVYYFEESGVGYYLDGYILERGGCAVEFLPGAVS
ncbi:hypothetical protein [Microbulbifer sp. PSTR4-B]|uniref:hypothetical protein n=1 Tax=Microbulbifer sp. PSTR4-B TaxID=3243396 RepID=UPI00403A2E45